MTNSKMNKENLLAAFGDDNDLMLNEAMELIGVDSEKNLESSINSFVEQASVADIQFIFECDGHRLFPDLEDKLVELMGSDAAYAWMD